jgi:hypothetical protein
MHVNCVSRQVIPPVDLADAAVEIVLLAGWELAVGQRACITKASA